MRVHHLNCGTMCPYSERLLSGRGSLLSRARLVCHCLLVELSSGLLLIDTGLGTADVRDPRGRLGRGFLGLAAPLCLREETALAQIESRGLCASDVRHLMPTHLDLDHAGGISDFPDATVHILAREHAAATALATRAERQRYKPKQWAGARFELHEPRGERWLGFESVRALPGTQDEVLIIPLHGHTRGHAGIAVRTAAGWLLHAGDAYFHHDDVHSQPPAGPLALELFQQAIQVDGSERLRNRARLAELVRTHGSASTAHASSSVEPVTVICAHDPREFDALAG